MKQTNNAIKFLMAQYRAIFKNANIAMVAAMAAAALAAGQAQAADLDKKDTWNGLNAQDITVGGDKPTYDKINISAGNGTDFNNADKAFTITIKGGADNVIKGSAAGAAVKAPSGSLVIDGADAAKTVLTIGGDAASGAAVTLDSVNVKAGTLNISGKDQDSSLTAKAIILGSKPESGETPDASAKAAAAANATINVGLSGAITTSESFDIYNGGELKFAQNATAAKSKVTATKGINLDGGTISVAAGGAALIEGKVDATNGTINVNGKDNGNTALTVSGDVTFSGDSSNLSVGKSGTFTVSGGNLKLGSATVSNAGTIEINGIAAKTHKSLEMTSSQYEQIFKGKLSFSGADANTSVLDISITGKEAIDLDAILKDGARDDDKLALNTASFSIKADNAKYAAGSIKIAKDKPLTFGTLTVGDQGAFVISGSSVTIENGLAVTKSGDKAELTVNNEGVLTLDGSGKDKKLDVTKITLGDGSKSGSLVVKNGDWSVGSVEVTSSGAFQLKGGSVTLNEGANLSIAKGDGVTADNAKIDASKAGVINLPAASSVSLSNGAKLILDAADVYAIEGDKVTLTSGDGTKASKFIQDAVKADSSSFLELKTDKTVTADEAGKIKAAIASTGFSGFLDFGGKVEASKAESVEYGSAGMMTGVNGVYDNTQVIMKSDNNIGESLSAANLKLSGSGSTAVANVTDGKALVLVNANSKLGGGKFVQDSTGAVAGVNLAGATSALILNGSGEIGSITATTKDQGTLTVGGAVNGNGVVTVKGAIGDSAKAVKNVTINAGSTLAVEGTEAAKDVYTNTLTINAGGSLQADKNTVTVTATSGNTIDGNLSANKLVFSTADSSVSFENGAFVNVDELSVNGTDAKIQVGSPASEGETGSSATLEAGKLTLAKGTLFVDPALGQKAAIAAVKTLSKTESDGKGTDAQVLDGNIIVGMNSAVGVGFDTRAEVEDLLIQSNYMDPVTKSFKEGTDALHAALILNTPIKIDNGTGVVVNAAATSQTTASADTLNLSANSALVINDSVFSVGTDGKKSGTAVLFGKTGGSGTVSAASGNVILAGDFDGADTGIQIFGNATGAEGVKVVSANGVLSGKLGADGTVASLTPDTDKLKGMFTTVSEPVRKLLQERIANQNNAFDKSQLGAQFLGSVTNDPKDLSGVKADAAAHAATYAGAQQAAVASVTTMADAMFGRVGAVGVEAASIAATGSQANGGVWLTPMYKSVDADGFNAQGASYGADVDLSGVAFGTDTVNGNMRFGAVFNIGSGDADGKGNGNGLKDEFDYYGFGIYSAMGFGNFALVGDASLTVVSHDVKGFDLHGKADTKAVTMGLTGQYTFATPVVDVTPHLGARFVRLDTESYDLNSAKGTIAITDFDVQNVFSVPVGVTLSKAFVAGGWSLAPNADLTVTFNSGDTDAKSTTTFTGARAIDLNSEVLDEVTYGVTLGLGAQYGAFGTSFGINYTGSENTDAFGVNAQCRYMF